MKEKVDKKFSGLLDSDPIKLKQYDPPHYKKLYIILILIPLLLFLAAVFWLLFNINGRGIREMKYGYEKD